MKTRNTENIFFTSCMNIFFRTECLHPDMIFQCTLSRFDFRLKPNVHEIVHFIVQLLQNIFTLYIEVHTIRRKQNRLEVRSLMRIKQLAVMIVLLFSFENPIGKIHVNMDLFLSILEDFCLNDGFHWLMNGDWYLDMVW